MPLPYGGDGPLWPGMPVEQRRLTKIGIGLAAGRHSYAIDQVARPYRLYRVWAVRPDAKIAQSLTRLPAEELFVRGLAWGTVPMFFAYEETYPWGTISIWPVPWDDKVELHIEMEAVNTPTTLASPWKQKRLGQLQKERERVATQLKALMPAA